MISPCIKECKIRDNICRGCGRAIEQIQNWMNYTNNEREQIIYEIKQNSD